jgi:ribosomal protein L3 glutamine methyltransferase
MNSVIDELLTLRDWLRWTVSRFEEAELFYGHGTDNAWDEAIWLLAATLRVPREHLDALLDARLTHGERSHLLHIIQLRVDKRIPTAYLTREAWLGPCRFYVDERVIVPRSYFAELLEDGLSPWIADPLQVDTALDLCTGSGCLAILMAQAFPHAVVDAIDLSSDALAVARRNVDDYDLGERIELVKSDLFAAVPDRRYDLIISNPPYVTAAAMAALPAEYRHEPGMALGAGIDGLDIVRRILAEAAQHLNPDGLLAIEVGHNRDEVEAAFPDLPCFWLDTEHAEGKVFLVRAEDL